MPATLSHQPAGTGPRGASDSGQGIVEYVLILALVAVITITAAIFLGGQTSDALSGVGGEIETISGTKVEATTPPSDYATKKACRAAGYTWVAKKKKVPAHCSE